MRAHYPNGIGSSTTAPKWRWMLIGSVFGFSLHLALYQYGTRRAPGSERRYHPLRVHGQSKIHRMEGRGVSFEPQAVSDAAGMASPGPKMKGNAGNL